MRKLLLVALSLGVAACSSSDGPSGSEAGLAGTPFFLTAQQSEGRAIFQTLCWTCHGSSGRGDGPALEVGTTPPPSFHTPDYARAEPGALERLFRTGVGGVDPSHPHMQYVASLLKPENFEAALAFIPALSYPPEIPGSALAGESTYRFRCAACHGMEGRGDGPTVPALVEMKPVDFTSDTLIANRDWDGLYRRISEGGQSVHGSSMPPWSMILTKNEMWDVVAYLATFQPAVLRPPYWLD